MCIYYHLPAVVTHHTPTRLSFTTFGPTHTPRYTLRFPHPARLPCPLHPPHPPTTPLPTPPPHTRHLLPTLPDLRARRAHRLRTPRIRDTTSPTIARCCTTRTLLPAMPHCLATATGLPRTLATLPRTVATCFHTTHHYRTHSPARAFANLLHRIPAVRGTVADHFTLPSPGTYTSHHPTRPTPPQHYIHLTT